MDGIQPYYLTQIAISISNLLVNGSSPPVSLTASTPFHITYRVTNSTGYAQMVYGALINNATSAPITSPATQWGPQLIQNGAYVDIDYYFTTGLTTALNATLNVGHVEYSLTVASNNSSWGTATVTSPAPTPSSYYPGQTVTLQATAAVGYQFTNWTGGITGTTNPITINMGTGAATITANFTAVSNTYALTITAGTGGYITGTQSGSYVQGTAISIAATANSTFTFIDWTATGITLSNPSNASQSFTMPANAVTLTASFQSTGVCTAGNRECINGFWNDCVGGSWYPTTQTCCAAGDAQCINGVWNNCINGVWVPTSALCCAEGTQQCINGVWNQCTNDTWVPTGFPCTAQIPVEYIIIGGFAVVGGLVALAAATGGFAGYKIGKRRRA